MNRCEYPIQNAIFAQLLPHLEKNSLVIGKEIDRVKRWVESIISSGGEDNQDGIWHDKWLSKEIPVSCLFGVCISQLL